MTLEPYRDDTEYLLTELDRLDLLFRRHLEEWWDEHGRVLDEFHGLYVSDEEVDLLLPSAETETEASRAAPRTSTRPTRSDLDRRIEAAARTIQQRRQLTAEAGRSLRLDVLVERFDLEPSHREVLLVCLAPELDRKYETIYAYLQDNATLRRPTVDLVVRTLYRTENDRVHARSLFSHQSPLVRHRLVRRVDAAEESLLSTRLRLDDRLVDFLAGTDASDDLPEALADAATVTQPTRRFADVPVDDAIRASLRRLADQYADVDSSSADPLFLVTGPVGSGKTASVEALCTALDTAVLTVTADGADDELVALATREARLRGVPLHLTGVSTPRETGATEGNERDERDERTTGAEATVALLDVADAFDGPVFLSSTAPFSPRQQVRVTNHSLAVVDIPMPSYGRRLALWRAVDDLPAEVDPAVLASTFRLTPGQVDDAVAVARVVVSTAGSDCLTADAIYRGCRAQTGELLGTLARHVDPGYTWNDIVLPRDRLAHLREIASHITHQGTVYADWGFAERFSLGKGIIVLFTGASGTGKTMAAEIIANDVGLDLYKIDLARVVSKYIGETEKNLGRIFDEAAASNAILLFDEADALLGKRSEVQDAHDRYANIEVNYLLQRVEEHDGAVILTTNFEQNIDGAFLRRVHHSVDFPLPDRDSRERIWRSIFPTQTPVGDLDYGFLTTFDLTGGNIKNVALTAAFMAAADGEVVEMRHVVRATVREFQKAGTVVSPEEFGAYRGLLSH